MQGRWCRGWALRLGLLIVLARILAGAEPSAAQGTRADYERAAGLRQQVRNRVYRDTVEPHWFDGGSRFWYRVRTGPGEHEFVLVDAEAGLRQPAFEHARLAEALAAAGFRGVRAEQLPLEDLQFDLDAQTVNFRARGRRWICDLATYAIEKGEPEEPPGETLALRPPEEAPSASTRTGTETALTFDNRSGGPVEIFWLDPQGERRSYGTVAAGAQRQQHTYAGHAWLVVDSHGRALGGVVAAAQPATVPIGDEDEPRPEEEPPAEAPSTALAAAARPRGSRPSGGARSPDGNWRAFFRNHNVYIQCLTDREEFALSDDGSTDDGYGGRLHWSPDSSRLVVVRTRAGEDRQIPVIESSPRDRLHPQLHTFSYAKPGDALPIDRPHLFDVGARRPIPVDDALFDNPWSIRDIRWSPDSHRFTFVYNERGHQVLRLLAVDAETGAVRPIVEETNTTFIEYAHKYFLRYLDDSEELVWMSERDGWNHLYLYDAQSGAVKHQITSGDWVVRGVERVDAQRRQVWFRAGGIHPDQDPYHVHFARVDFDGGNLVVLTEGDGTYTVDFSPDRRFFIASYSRVDMPPVVELRCSEDGVLVCQLEQADWSALLETGWQVPERFSAKGRDGETDIYGVVYRPTTFDPEGCYPVIESIYAGPQGAFVPKGFRSFHAPQAMAELGFIVVQIDGMGTSHRSKAFHDVCWQNLADSGLPDRRLWIEAAAAERPYMDLARVGIYGGSAGGQSTAAALFTHGDFYHVGVADCGCHDNRMDKVWWNELWMGWPVGPHYEANSNVTLAEGLTGKLLLIVGELDRNVDPASTMQVVDALVRADKDFDLLVIPGAGHGAAETPYGSRRRADYFVRHLLGVEPRWEP